MTRGPFESPFASRVVEDAMRAEDQRQDFLGAHRLDAAAGANAVGVAAQLQLDDAAADQRRLAEIARAPDLNSVLGPSAQYLTRLSEQLRHLERAREQMGAAATAARDRDAIASAMGAAVQRVRELQRAIEVAGRAQEESDASSYLRRLLATQSKLTQQVAQNLAAYQAASSAGEVLGRSAAEMIGASVVRMLAAEYAGSGSGQTAPSTPAKSRPRRRRVRTPSSSQAAVPPRAQLDAALRQEMAGALSDTPLAFSGQPTTPDDAQVANLIFSTWERVVTHFPDVSDATRQSIFNIVCAAIIAYVSVAVTLNYSAADHSEVIAELRANRENTGRPATGLDEARQRSGRIHLNPTKPVVLRSAASAHAPSLGTLQEEDVLEVIDALDRWRYVCVSAGPHAGSEGWVYYRNLRPWRAR
jgi:hypothetical protein